MNTIEKNYILTMGHDLNNLTSSITFFNSEGKEIACILPDTFEKRFDICLSISNNDTNHINELIYDFKVNVEKFFGTELPKKEDFILKKEDENEQAIILLNKFFKFVKENAIIRKDWDLFLELSNITLPTKTVGYIKVKKNGEKELTEIPSFNYNDCKSEKEIDESLDKVLNVLPKNNFNDNLFSAIHKYKCSNSKEMLIAIISNYFKHNPDKVILRCLNCSKLFTAGRADAKYCERISPQNRKKTCRQYIDYKKQTENMDDPIKKLAKNVFNTIRNRVQYGYGGETEEDLKEFKITNKIKKAKCKSGELSEEEYIKWLKSHYKNK